MIDRSKCIKGLTRDFILANEGKEVKVNSIMTYLRQLKPHLKPQRDYVSTLIAELHRESDDMYKVDWGVYVYDRSRSYTEFVSRHDQLMTLIAEKDGMITLDDIIGRLLITKEAAYTMLDQLKYGKGNAQKNVKVERVTYYHIEVKGR